MVGYTSDFINNAAASSYEKLENTKTPHKCFQILQVLVVVIYHKLHKLIAARTVLNRLLIGTSENCEADDNVTDQLICMFDWCRGAVERVLHSVASFSRLPSFKKVIFVQRCLVSEKMYIQQVLITMMVTPLPFFTLCDLSLIGVQFAQIN